MRRRFWALARERDEWGGKVCYTERRRSSRMALMDDIRWLLALSLSIIFLFGFVIMKISK